jgi:hypothetical protein
VGTRAGVEAAGTDWAEAYTAAKKMMARDKFFTSVLDLGEMRDF